MRERPSSTYLQLAFISHTYLKAKKNKIKEGKELFYLPRKYFLVILGGSFANWLK
jgi:hypothetical protein